MTVEYATILHPCQFTRFGLINLLPSSCRVCSTEKIRQCQLYLLSVKKPNLIILSLQGADYTVMDVLSLINMIYQENRQHRVLVIMDIYRNSGLVEYLRETRSQIAFIDTQRSMSFVARQINNFIINNLSAVVATDKKAAKFLSLRERQILDGILMEFNYKQIAQMLSISPKLVGHYKRQALRKLRAKSMQSLLMPTNQSFKVTATVSIPALAPRTF
ncbi:LuxR C-terminal-related transcriptional regulator [Serratia sp. D1N4]